MKERLPINDQIIVAYSSGDYSRLFHEYTSTYHFFRVCTDPFCDMTEEHCIFDGQFFHQGVKKRA